MAHSLNEKLFFLDNDHEVNRLVFKIGGVFMAVLVGLLAAAYFDIFKVEAADVLKVMGLLLFVEIIFYLMLIGKAPVAAVKYYGLLAMEFCLIAMSANAYFGIYITYILVPAISCLYFDRKLTLNIIIIGYIGMLIGLWLRAPGSVALAYQDYTRERWFIAFGLGYTMEYAALSAVLYAASDRARRYLEELYSSNEKISDIQNKIIFRFADLVESRDDNTGKHIKRTSKYVVMLANRLRRGGPIQSSSAETTL